ncbi:uncharacterized protein LOC109862689 [Pseudomyrmex gracilis]|uniref:uncharacterized protein LOC109862689 n=1 Tax=Pseudomyrmex gracilis TaxID=219809 RepID=UPI000994E2E0|nr:uncharacterized protein LOC109862689 [Pseudomyrmex gracilis]
MLFIFWCKIQTWYPVLIALETMSKIVPFPESVLSRNIKNKLLEILNKFLDDISYTNSSKNSANNQFYHEVLKWTCILGSLKCKEHVNGIVNWHFEHSTQNKLLSSWQKWIYCQRLMVDTFTYVTSTVWEDIVKIYQTQGKLEQLFEFLPCSKQYKNLLSFLSVLHRNSLIIRTSSLKGDNGDFYKEIVHEKKNVTVTVLFKIFAMHSKNMSALDVIRIGLENGIGRDVNILAIINCIINNIYSDDGLLKIGNTRFLKKLLHMHHIGNESFVLDAINEKIKIRRMFLVEMETTLYCYPHYIFNFVDYRVSTNNGCK